MTQAVSNNLINFQDALTQLNQQTKSAVSGMPEFANKEKTEKFADFSRVFEKQVAKEDIKTLGDLKSKKISVQTGDNWADFQEILSKITDEANIETSLDLTLARDINEIISQLKEAIDETIDETEDLVEKTVVVEEVTTTQTIDDDLCLDELVTLDESVEDEVDEKDSLDTSNLWGEILSYSNNSGFMSRVENFTEKVSENVSDNLNTYTSDSENFEVFNNLSAEDTAKTSDTLQDISEQLIDEDMLKELNLESLEAQADTAEQESLMDSQTPQEQAVKAILNSEVESFDIKIDKVSQAQQFTQPQVKTIDVNPSKILDQIARQLEGLQNNSKVNIVLNPEALGRVTIQLIKTGEGLSAQFTVSNQEVRDMLMKGLEGLKDSLLSQGVGVDNVSVRVSDMQKTEYEADWTEQEGSEGGNKEQGRSNKEEKEKGLFEKMMAQTLEDENGNV